MALNVDGLTAFGREIVERSVPSEKSWAEFIPARPGARLLVSHSPLLFNPQVTILLFLTSELPVTREQFNEPPTIFMLAVSSASYRGGAVLI